MEYPNVCVAGEEIIVLQKDRLVEVSGLKDNAEGCAYVAIPADLADKDLNGKAIYLDSDFDWILGKSDGGSLLCIPLKKEEEENK